VSLDWEDYEGDETLCDRENGVVTLATFFILLSQQGKGYGSVVMRQVEQMAVEVGAKEITLNTVVRSLDLVSLDCLPNIELTRSHP
jgi:GNAT superfamily N-acetyltransferase